MDWVIAAAEGHSYIVYRYWHTLVGAGVEVAGVKKLRMKGFTAHLKSKQWLFFAFAIQTCGWSVFIMFIQVEL